MGCGNSTLNLGDMHPNLPVSQHQDPTDSPAIGPDASKVQSSAAYDTPDSLSQGPTNLPAHCQEAFGLQSIAANYFDMSALLASVEIGAIAPLKGNYIVKLCEL